MVTLAFGQPLSALLRHTLQSELLSYVPLMPLVVGYLLYFRRATLPTEYRTSIAGAAALVGASGIAITAAIMLSGRVSTNDVLSLQALGYICAIGAGGFLFLGAKWMAAAAFPVTLLVFMVPLPDVAVDAIESASVTASADVSALLFGMTGTPLLRDSTVFVLPGIVLEIAQECSGIHSSWILFVTSLVASNLFLHGPWRRLMVVAFVFPLAIIRNSFRILVIGLLCVHIGPEMIHSYIHRQGGPIFFALSLIPLFLLLVWLRRQER